ncbi:MAG: hypothetical protein ACRYGI_16890 [Janthinobacterium lividum]
MRFYRGDNRLPLELNEGFKPQNAPTTATPANRLKTDLASAGNARDMGFVWRKQTPGGLIATARHREGSYEGMKALYTIDISDDRLFISTFQGAAIKPLGRLTGLPDGTPPGGDYLITDTHDVSEANIIAFSHGLVSSKETTFLTAIERKYITGFLTGADTNKSSVGFQKMPPPVPPKPSRFRQQDAS